MLIHDDQTLFQNIETLYMYAGFFMQQISQLVTNFVYSFQRKLNNPVDIIPQALASCIKAERVILGILQTYKLPQDIFY